MAKFTKIGKQCLSKKGTHYIKLGEESQNPKFAYTTQIRVLNAAGEVVAQASNPMISLQDPRKNGKSCPEWILSDLVLVEDDAA